MTAQVRAPLEVTPRASLRAASSVNLHSSWGEPPWNQKADALADAVVAMGFGWVRDVLAPGSKAQQAFHRRLVANGVRLHLNYAGARRQYIASDVLALSRLDYAHGVGHLAGENEANSAGGDKWPVTLAAGMKVLRASRDAYLPDALVTGPGLKHEHVKDYDADLIAARPVVQYVDAGLLAFHYYPGIGGPVSNAAEWARAEAGYGYPVGIHEETGIEWTQQKDPAARARFQVETLLRNYLSGIALTNLYELADDSTGDFGIMGTASADAIAALLAATDGGEAIPARLSRADDCGAVVTSEGGGRWTIYLLRAANQTATLVLDPAYQADSGGYTVGDAGNRRYTVGLTESMTVVRVSPAA